MELGYELQEVNGRLEISFPVGYKGWSRFLSKLVEDEVIADLEEAKKLLATKGDLEIYKVFNLGEFVDSIKKISNETNIACDLTLLRHGVFSPIRRGESFLTYGHLHIKPYGEVYKVLKNECLLLLSDKDSSETFLLHLREGNSILIHPKFLHRLVALSKDCLVVGFVPKDAGHDYAAVKGKGFPVKVVFDEDEKKFYVEKRRKVEVSVIDRIITHLDPVGIFEKEPFKLKEILVEPEKNLNIYFPEMISDYL